MVVDGVESKVMDFYQVSPVVERALGVSNRVQQSLTSDVSTTSGSVYIFQAPVKWQSCCSSKRRLETREIFLQQLLLVLPLGFTLSTEVESKRKGKKESFHTVGWRVHLHGNKATVWEQRSSFKSRTIQPIRLSYHGRPCWRRRCGYS